MGWRTRGMQIQALGGFMAKRGGELRLALRTTLAGLATFALAEAMQLPQGYWAVLTSVIIMQGSVGGSLKAGIDRLIGSFAGAIWGVAVTLAIPHHGIPTLGLALVVALGPLALVSALKPSFRIAPVTAIIVLLSTSSLQADPGALCRRPGAGDRARLRRRPRRLAPHPAGPRGQAPGGSGGRRAARLRRAGGTPPARYRNAARPAGDPGDSPPSAPRHDPRGDPGRRGQA